MLSIICAAIVIFQIENQLDIIPPIVKGTMVRDGVHKDRDAFLVNFTDLKGNKRQEWFEANACKFED